LDSEYEAPVTDWLMFKACADTAGQSSQQRVSVNVSSLMVGRRDLPDVVSQALTCAGLDPARLVLELTEDRLLSKSNGSELLARLRRLGVSLALDDFGSGYSGLGYLRRFPAIDILKVDRSFVSGLGEDPVCEHIVRALNEMARSCELDIVAEGVETEAQAEILRTMGVAHAQGFLFGRPAPLAS
jgi:EAL domain-containing protein (putative c-di-GMP-specific phosphodiesterase class I)